MTLKYEWKKYIEEMRLHGYAVTIFNPEELGNADPSEVEDILVERGANAIEFFNDMAEEEQ